MKRSIITAGLVFVIALAGLAITYFYVNGQQDQVNIRETVLKGDPAAAEGITLKFKTCDVDTGQLLWNTDYRISSGAQARSEFQRVTNGRYCEDWDKNEASFYEAFPSGHNSDEENSVEKFPSSAIEDLIKDIAGRTKNGETLTETYQMKDYFDYYPLDLQVDMTEEKPYIGVNTSTSDYFKIPAPENYPLDVSVTKDGQGNITSYDILSAGNSLTVDTKSLCTSDGCYLALDTPYYTTDYVTEESGDENTTIKIPLSDKMRAIHYLPFIAKEKDDQKWYEVDWKNARPVYMIPAGVKVSDIQSSPDGKNLLLFTEEQGQTYFSVIDMESMKLLQKICLVHDKKTSYMVMKNHGDDILVFLENGQFYLFTQKGNQYTMELSDHLYRMSVLKDVSMRPPFLSFDYDGKRLAIAATDVGDLLEVYNCSCYLFLFDKEGLQYAGYYKNSLSHKVMYTGSSYRVCPANTFAKGTSNKNITYINNRSKIDALEVKL